MLTVSPVNAEPEHHTDQRERQRHQDRQRIDERAELHHQDEVHQHHRHAQRDEDVAEHLGLLLRVAARGVGHAGRQLERPASRACTSVITSPVLRPLTFHSTLTTRSRFEVVDHGRAEALLDPRHLARAAGCWARPSGPATTSGSCRRSSARRRASGESRTSTSRVSPDGSTQSPASIPANAGRSDCATWPTVTPSEPASPRLSSTLSSGFCPLLESEMSTAFGHRLHLRAAPSPRPR